MNRYAGSAVDFLRLVIIAFLALLLPGLAGAIPVAFHYHAPNATTVTIRASWNNWTDGIDVMAGPDANGDWTHTVDLTPGAWEYKFFVDGGTWLADPENPVLVGGYGNSGLQVASPMLYYVKPMPGSVFPPGSTIRIQSAITWASTTTLDTAASVLRVDGNVITSGPAGYDAATRTFSWAVTAPLSQGSHTFDLTVATNDGAGAYTSGTFTYHANPTELYYDQFDYGITQGNPGDMNQAFWSGARNGVNYQPAVGMPPTLGVVRESTGAATPTDCVSRSLVTGLPANDYEVRVRVRLTDFLDTVGERNAEVATRYDGTNGYLLTVDGGNDQFRLRRRGGGYTDLVPPVSHPIHPGDVYYLYMKVTGTGPVALTARVATDTTFAGPALLMDVTTTETTWIQNGTTIDLQAWTADGDRTFDFDYFSIGEPGYSHPPSAWLRTGYTDAPPAPPRVTVGDLDSYEVLPGGIALHSGSATVHLTPLLDRTLRVDFVTTGTLRPRPSFAVTRTAWPDSTFSVTDADPLVITGPQWRVDVSRHPMRLKFCRPDGTPYFGEHADSPLTAYGASRSTGFTLDATEGLYGLGETSVYANDGLNRRGSLFDINNRHEPPSYLVWPTWVSSHNWGVFVDNPSQGTLSLGNTAGDRIDYVSREGELTYYVFLGSTMYDVVDQFTQVTGRPALPPRWTLGNIQSKYGYTSFAEIQAIIDGFTSRQIPLDGIVMDLDWFGRETMGNLEFQNTANWANPVSSMAALHAQGYRFIPITEPQISGLSTNASAVTTQGLVGRLADGVTAYPVTSLTWITNQAPCYLMDFTRPAARTFWKQRHQKLIQQYQFDGFWQDLNEPEGQPDDMLYDAGSSTAVHNAIAISMNRALDEAIQEYRPGGRTFLMSRSGYVGMQKYGASVWSGDTACSFDQLAKQPALAQSMGLAGVPYWNSDIGGFNGTPTGELYTRWCQFGLFNPLYRPHGAQSNREPWRFGTTVQSRVTEIIRLRYRLLPYYYTVSRESYDTGSPIMRPLVMDWPNDAAVANLGSEFLYGPSLLAAPVTQQGATTWPVYLPAGRWVDWFTRAGAAGPVTLNLDVSAGKYPCYVRAPAIIPLGPLLARSDAAPLTPVTLRVFLPTGTSSASGSLYEDDGLTTAYQSGACARTTFVSSRQANGNLTVDVSAAVGSFPGQLAARDYIVEVPVPAVPISVRADGVLLTRLADSSSEPASVGWSYDSTGVVRARANSLATSAAHTFAINIVPGTAGWTVK